MVQPRATLAQLRTGQQEGARRTHAPLDEPDMESSGPAKELSRAAIDIMHFWTRAMCSRTLEAPWTFHDYAQQQLGDCLIRGLLQITVLAGVSYGTVSTAVKE